MGLDTPLHLASTQRFIDERPVDVVVKRTQRQATAAGGQKRVPLADLAPQKVRITELLRAQATTQRTTEDGDVVIPSHVAVAMPSADFQRKDTFTAYGELWEVVYVSRLPEWRISLELISRGTAA